MRASTQSRVSNSFWTVSSIGDEETVEILLSATDSESEKTKDTMSECEGDVRNKS